MKKTLHKPSLNQINSGVNLLEIRLPNPAGKQKASFFKCFAKGFLFEALPKVAARRVECQESCLLKSLLIRQCQTILHRDVELSATLFADSRIQTGSANFALLTKQFQIEATGKQLVGFVVLRCTLIMIKVCSV